MWSHFQLSVVWVGIQLVSVAAVTTTSTCDVVKFNQSKSQSGEVLCATAPPPQEAVAMNTKMECSRECAGRGAMCAGGFNYKHQEALCELFIGSATTLQVQDGCEHYQVCTSRCAIYRALCHCITLY